MTYCAEPPPGVRSERLAKFRALVSLPMTDRLATRPSVRLRDLAHLPLVLLADPDSAGVNAVCLAACEAAGLHPEIREMPRGDSVVAFARADGFTFVSPAANGAEPDGVVHVEIDGPAPTLHYDLMWHDDRVTPFLQVDREVRRARLGALSQQLTRHSAWDLPISATVC